MALVLIFPVPGLWKIELTAVMALRRSRVSEWHILSKDTITVFHISVPPQAKAEAACSALQTYLPHFKSALSSSYFLLLSMPEAARSLLPLIGVRQAVSFLQQRCLELAMLHLL